MRNHRVLQKTLRNKSTREDHLNIRIDDQYEIGLTAATIRTSVATTIILYATPRISCYPLAA